MQPKHNFEFYYLQQDIYPLMYMYVGIHDIIIQTFLRVLQVFHGDLSSNIIDFGTVSIHVAMQATVKISSYY